MTAYESLFTADHEKLEEVTNQRLFFLNFLSQDQRENAIVHFIKNGLFSDEIRKFFHEKPEFIIRMARRCGWEVDQIVKFIIPNIDDSNIAYIALRNYAISLLFQERNVDMKSCKKRPQLPVKSEIDVFLELKGKEITCTEIISILNVNKDYIENELYKILNHINNVGTSLYSYYYLLKTEKRYAMTLNCFHRMNYSEYRIGEFIKYNGGKFF